MRQSVQAKTGIGDASCSRTVKRQIVPDLWRNNRKCLVHHDDGCVRTAKQQFVRRSQWSIWHIVTERCQIWWTSTLPHLVTCKSKLRACSWYIASLVANAVGDAVQWQYMFSRLCIHLWPVFSMSPATSGDYHWTCHRGANCYSQGVWKQCRAQPSLLSSLLLTCALCAKAHNNQFYEFRQFVNFLLNNKKLTNCLNS